MTYLLMLLLLLLLFHVGRMLTSMCWLLSLHDTKAAAPFRKQWLYVLMPVCVLQVSP
jgi:hypothetical protein